MLTLALLFLLACGDKPPDATNAPNDGCARWGDGQAKVEDPDCPCADVAMLLDGGSKDTVTCRPDQRVEWGPTPAEDGNVSAVCRCVR